MKSVLMGLGILLGANLAVAKDAVNINPTQYIVSTGIYIDGKLVSNPRIALLEGEETEVSQRSTGSEDGIVMKVTAKKAPLANKPGAIQISYDVHYKKGNQEVRTTPRMILLEGKTGTIEVVEKTGPKVALEVSAKRLN